MDSAAAERSLEVREFDGGSGASDLLMIFGITDMTLATAENRPLLAIVSARNLPVARLPHLRCGQ